MTPARRLFRPLAAVVLASLTALGPARKPVVAQTETADAALRDRVLQLVERLDDPKPEIRDDAQARLIKLGPKILTVLPDSSIAASKERKDRLEDLQDGPVFAQAVMDEPTVAALHDEATPSQFEQMPGHGRSNGVQYRRDLADGQRAMPEHCENPETGRVTERLRDLYGETEGGRAHGRRPSSVAPYQFRVRTAAQAD